MHTRDWELWSTTARLVVTDDDAAGPAAALVEDLLAEVAAACNRFDPSSELMCLAPGRSRVSPMLAQLLEAALDVAARTDGAVDPTVGGALVALGYDRDWADLSPVPGEVRVVAAPGWEDLRLEGNQLTLPAGVLLDLGATAKALAADLGAARVAERLGTGVLLELGGDVATAGPGPVGGWQVLVQDLPGDPAQQVTLSAGAAVASSSSVRRTWAGGSRHHIVDPTSGHSSRTPWRTVTVVAGSCLDANAAATATLAMGERGVGWLAATSLPTRLVGRGLSVVSMNGWPSQERAA